MPLFKFHFRHRDAVEPDEGGTELRDIHAAYLQACAAIPDEARDQLIAGRDPMVCAYIICDEKGRRLMEVPFTEYSRPQNGSCAKRVVGHMAVCAPKRLATP